MRASAKRMIRANAIDFSAELKLAIASRLSVLDRRTREIIVLRFGLGGELARTERALGDEFFLSRLRVSQVVERALRRMKIEIA